ncbi:MAG: hypothetical protein H0U75_03260 [Legionella sp.]|nr:hypothetical protein [Legionella sp.]
MKTYICIKKTVFGLILSSLLTAPHASMSTPRLIFLADATDPKMSACLERCTKSYGDVTAYGPKWPALNAQSLCSQNTSVCQP